MNCKDCGLEVPNIGALNRHKKDCPGRPEEAKPAKTVIPWQDLPPEFQYLSKGDYMGVKVYGYVTDEGLQIEATERIR